MIPAQALATLERLVARLPFHLDDIEQANLWFDRWRRNGNAEERQVVDLWTYCYIWRSVLMKFTRNPDLNPSDFDMLVAQVFERAVSRRHTVREPGRYAQWVSVVCRNAFINHVRVRKKNAQVRPAAESPMHVAEPADLAGDGALLYQVIERAIAQLPGHLARVARMRLFDELDYEEISGLTGKSVPVVRSYANKALRRLRDDPSLRLFIHNDVCKDSEN